MLVNPQLALIKKHTKLSMVNFPNCSMQWKLLYRLCQCDKQTTESQKEKWIFLFSYFKCGKIRMQFSIAICYFYISVDISICFSWIQWNLIAFMQNWSIEGILECSRQRRTTWEATRNNGKLENRDMSGQSEKWHKKVMKNQIFIWSWLDYVVCTYGRIEN